jgi:hypothetical protein
MPVVHRLASSAIVLALAGALLAGAALLAGCGGGTTQREPVPDGNSEATAEPTAAPAGVVETPPVGSTVVNVNMEEWLITAAPGTAAPGPVYFLVANEGMDAHELIVARHDADPSNLPIEDGIVPEDALDIVDEIEPFAGGSDASILLDLEPGRYVLFCNLVEVEDGVPLGHYQMGMYTGLTVE